MNQVYTQSITAFGPQQPVVMHPIHGVHDLNAEMIPNGAYVDDNGSMIFSMYAPGANEVKVEILGLNIIYQLRKLENGLWTDTVKSDLDGFLSIAFYVDGVKVLNEMAPIGFGATHPMNYLDVPGKNSGCFDLKEVPHGSVRHEYYYSKTTGQYECCVVYTPPEYDSSKEKYPVLYLQHGHGENENSWVWQGKVNFILDNLLAEQKAIPCIIVMNNGMVMMPKEDGGRYFNPLSIEQVIIDDCIPYIEKKFRVKQGKENRAMAGLSMGSMQTSIVTLSHPELFSYAGIFSGFLCDVFQRDGGNPHLKLLDDRQRFEESFRVFFRAIGTEDPFINVYEEDGKLLEEKNMTPEQCKAMMNKTYSGSHEWKVWRLCAFDFLQLLWK